MKASSFLRLPVATALFFAASLGVRLDAENPAITDKFTADPAALVYKETVYLYVGHDESPEKIRIMP